MKIGVRVKLNVSQIDKARLFKGNKGVYLDATVFIDIDQKDQYDNNGMITQDITKEEKDNGVQGNILGNVQVFWSDSNTQAPQQQGGFQQQQQQQAPTQVLQQKRQAAQQGLPGAAEAHQKRQQGQVTHQQQGGFQQSQAHPVEIDFTDEIPF